MTAPRFVTKTDVEGDLVVIDTADNVVYPFRGTIASEVAAELNAGTDSVDRYLGVPVHEYGLGPIR